MRLAEAEPKDRYFKGIAVNWLAMEKELEGPRRL